MGGGTCDMTVFVMYQFIGRYFGNLSKNDWYSVFQAQNGEGKNQFLIENTMVTVFIQKYDYGITVIFEKIDGNTVIRNLVRPPLSSAR